MFSVSKVTQPSLQRWRVVFADHSSICYDGSVTREGCPLSSSIIEGHIDGGVGFEVIGLSGLGVGVEDKINASVFLVPLARTRLIWSEAHCSSQGHTSGSQTSGTLRCCCHHAELASFDESDEVLNLLLCTGLFLVLCLVSGHR